MEDEEEPSIKVEKVEKIEPIVKVKIEPEIRQSSRIRVAPTKLNL